MKGYFELTEAEKKYLRDGETAKEKFLSPYATGDFEAIYPKDCRADIDGASILRPP